MWCFYTYISMGYSLIPKWLFWVLILLILHSEESRGCIEKEKLALLRIKQHLSSISSPPNHPLLPSWVDEGKQNCCSWERVKCDSSTDHIIELSLSGLLHSSLNPMYLNVTLFEELEELQGLDLSYNFITSLVEDEAICKLRNLQVLNLTVNAINGGIPNCIGSLSCLRKLDLSGNQFTGNIPSELCNLKRLQMMDQSSNELNGRLPRCIGNLNPLQYLSLSNNGFSGSIESGLCKLAKLEWLNLGHNNLDNKLPSCVGNLTSLQVLLLSHNYLSGRLPSGICKLKKLQNLILHWNYFNESLPNCIGNLSSLKVVDLSNNQFTGSIPSTISSLTSLEELSMSHNSFDAKFSLSLLSNHANLTALELSDNLLEVETEDKLWTPSFQLQILALRDCSLNNETKTFPKFLLHQHHLMNLDLSNSGLVGSFPNISSSRLQILDLSQNQLSGKIPGNIGLVLSSLVWLDLSSNNFEGWLPSSIGEVKGIERLDLSDNKFDGEVPKQLFNCSSKLRYMSLSNNNLRGKLVPESMNLTGLDALFLDNNRFDGIIEDSLLKSSYLQFLDISNNEMSGEMPIWIGMLKQLQHLSIRGNTLQGEIPSAICNLSSLLFLDLSNNRLSGQIPWIDQLSKLVVLQLGNNKLQGGLPSQLCHLQHLNIMDMANNEISGFIPPCIQNLSFGTEKTQTNFEFEDYLEFLTKDRYYSYFGDSIFLMSGLDLSCNQISGHIPEELGDLREIRSLNLSHNKLIGLIPKTFSKLRSIESLDLSDNNLSGPIPLALTKLDFLEVFNVSYNNLSGRVPVTGQFGTFDAYSYEGNPFLCGNVQGRSCAAIESEPSTATSSLDKGEGKEMTKFDWVLFFWSFGVSYTIFALGFLLVLYDNPHWLNACLNFIETHIHRCFRR